MRLLLFVTLCLIYLNSYTQKNNLQKPLIIRARIENCNDPYLELVLADKESTDTLWPGRDGYYYLTTYRIKKPLETIIVSRNIQIQNLLVAPGYDLTITGDGNDNNILAETKRVTGTGSESNSYYISLDSIRRVGYSGGDMNTSEGKMAQINYHFAMRDSLANAVFKRKNSNDSFQTFFFNKIRLDNVFMKIGAIISLHRSPGLNYNQIKNILKQNVDASILQHMSKDSYLISDFYKELITGDYLTFLIEMDYLKDSSLKNNKSYRVEKIRNTYTGKVKEYAIKEAIERRFFWSKTVDELNEYRQLFQSYIDDLADREYRDKLYKLYSDKSNELIQTQIGKPAPIFTLKNIDGKTYSNKDFNGKVIFLDFWASWCFPCRQETPYLQEVYNKYSGDNRIVFISVAVGDREKGWRRALQEDKPSWLQLFDADDQVRKQYATYEIPKFALIDKEGNIASFDAPRPSEKEKLITFLDQVLNK